MPTYDTKCSSCGYVGIEQLKLATLSSWDQNACCPDCGKANGIYKRVITSAAANHNLERSAQSKKLDSKAKFVSSGERDAMMHETSKRIDRHQIAAARESVRKGEFEGF